MAKLRGWRERNGLFVPAEGEAAGWIQHQPRAAWADLTTLVTMQTTTPGLVVESLSNPEAIVTAEGEDGAMVTARGRFNSLRVQRDLGYVFGEGFVSCVSSVVLQPAQFALFTETVWHLLRSVKLGLGHRRRAYRHMPPAGWRLDAGRTDPVSYHAPDDPFVRLDVWRAVPASQSAAHQFLSAGPDVEIERKDGPRQLKAGRLHGLTWEIVGRCNRVPILRRIVLLEDGRFVYPVRLDVRLSSCVSMAKAALDDLLETIVPIPRAEQEAA